MSIRNAGIGPQCYGRRSDAVVCVYSGKAGRFADFFHHVCESVDSKWPLLEPHVIFRTEICLRILKKSTAIRVDLFKVELQSLVAIVLVFRLVDSCFFLVTGFVIDTTSMVFGSFIVGRAMVANFRPTASTAKLKLLLVRALCPARPLRQKKRTTRNQIESWEESQQTPLALSRLI